jgi:hypothetical protein
MKRWAVALIVALLCVLGATIGVRAQVDTVNRSFHNLTSFPLSGRHLTVACESCHIGGAYKATPNTCFSCHWERRRDDRYQLRLGAQCENCHSATAWTAVRWDHSAATGVPIGVAHRTLGCDTCHSGGEFKATAVACVNCHQRDYQATKSPNHAAAGFPTTCETCHKSSDASFQGTRFEHSAVFPLAGRHATASCATCHKNNVYKGTSTDCVGCHRPEYERAQSPNHAAAGFPTACDSCHRASDPAWRGASSTQFNHSAVFPLQGAHAQQQCATCHKNNVYKGTPRDCVGCHQDTYNRTSAPNHAAAGFPTTCEQCHRSTDTSWRGGQSSSFNHSAVFPLQGVHAQQQCATCHKNNVYKGTPRDCVGCHQDLYTRTTTPPHASAGFPTTCEQCHKATDTQWRGAAFNHNQFFALQGAHAQQQCATCHKNNVYKGTRRDCVGCHQDLYTRTTTPPHAAAGFPTTCEQCHKATDTQWRGAAFNHNQFFALQGVHAQQQCATCHKNNVYKGTPRDCVGCHRTKYDQTRNPNHQTAGFPTTCESCHRVTDTAWTQGTFNHTWFPISGPHRRTCAECHLNSNNYKEFSCTVCHLRPKTDEQHRQRAGYRYDSVACYQCHPNGRSD